MIRVLLVAIFIVLSSAAIAGSLPQDRLSDPVLEGRAQHLFTQLRCLVCQNQTIADSDARIANDLRLLVRTRIQQGEDDASIMDYIHSRYGDFVLMRPPVNPSTWGLWFAPLILLAAGGATVFFVLRQSKKGTS